MEWISPSFARRPLPSPFGGIVAAALLLVVSILAFAPPAAAGDSDDKMLVITKTTVYGAVLGGLLGLTSSLVVDDDSRDDAIRWGVALGSIAGFVYGIINSHDDGLDFFAVRHSEDRDAVESTALAGDPVLSGIGIGLATGSRTVRLHLSE